MNLRRLLNIYWLSTVRLKYPKILNDSDKCCVPRMQLVSQVQSSVWQSYKQRAEEVSGVVTRYLSVYKPSQFYRSLSLLYLLDWPIP
ncbi:hypothetical protein J6590_030447 [Homalodisca vitripennis]|nr:hypothetical protein J6590_030447 [Homalodisca vitripennis]